MQKDKRHSSPKYCLSQIIAYANIAGYEIAVFVRYENTHILYLLWTSFQSDETCKNFEITKMCFIGM